MSQATPTTSQEQSEAAPDFAIDIYTLTRRFTVLIGELGSTSHEAGILNFAKNMGYFLDWALPSNWGSTKDLDIVPHGVQHKRRVVRRRVPRPHARLAIALATLSRDPRLVERVDSGPICTTPTSLAPRHRPHTSQ